ncbi:MAG: hypothetical protein ACJZ6C_03065 [Candidatus Poriferisodalaceae bacterium]
MSWGFLWVLLHMAADRHSAWSTNIGDRDFIGIVVSPVLESVKPVNWVNATVSISQPSDARPRLVDLAAIVSWQVMCRPVENH